MNDFEKDFKELIDIEKHFQTSKEYTLYLEEKLKKKANGLSIYSKYKKDVVVDSRKTKFCISNIKFSSYDKAFSNPNIYKIWFGIYGKKFKKNGKLFSKEQFLFYDTIQYELKEEKEDGRIEAGHVLPGRSMDESTGTDS